MQTEASVCLEHEGNLVVHCCTKILLFQITQLQISRFHDDCNIRPNVRCSYISSGLLPMSGVRYVSPLGSIK